jgi:D-serine deaminase-like pyridoxal phosphate-dependent protein
MNDPLYWPPTGTPADKLPTPALLIDLPKMESNLAEMSAFFRDKPARLRPHFKTHKSPLIAQKQMAAGAIGMTCAKLGEAEILATTGIPSILIANQVVDPRKIGRLAQLALGRQLIVAVDQVDNLRHLSQAATGIGSTIYVVIEVDVGMHRCGVQPGEVTLPLAQLAAQLPGIHFAGVMGYEGHTVFEPDPARRWENVQQAMRALVNTAESIRSAGHDVEIVSAGGTGTYNLTGIYPGVTEIEAGSYPFMDTKYNGLHLNFQNALSLLATVISIPANGRAVIDAGMKSLTTDNGLPQVIHPQGVKLLRLNEEHGILEITDQAGLHVGDRVELLPSHVCTTVNLHDQYYVLHKGVLEAIWPIAGRGKSQ